MSVKTKKRAGIYVGASGVSQMAFIRGLETGFIFIKNQNRAGENKKQRKPGDSGRKVEMQDNFQMLGGRSADPQTCGL